MMQQKYNVLLLVLCSCFAIPSLGQSDDSKKIIQYDEGNFGKINLHDLAESSVTTYSPIVFVKRPKYISELGERPLIDKQYKHNFDQPEDRNDSRYVYNYVDRELKVFDLPEGQHLEPLAKHLRERVLIGGVEEETLAKRIKIARKYGKEILLNYRLNDVHWGGPKPARPELQSQFSLTHPEYAVNPKGNAWKDGALNFAIPEVQDFLLKFYVEGINRFDNDGIIIDMMRNPTVFPPGTEWENRDKLTGFLRQVRKIVDTCKSARDGRTMTIGVRVPSTLAYCESVGMDLKTWAREKLVDFIAPSMFMKQDPNLQVAKFRRDLGSNTVKLYATLQRRNYGFGHSASFGQYRGMAANMWGNEHVDGLLLFNWMQQSREDYIRWKSGELLNGPHPDLANEISSLNALAKRNKVYSIAWGTDGQYPDMPMHNPLPIKISKQDWSVIAFGAFEDLSKNKPLQVTAILQVLPENRVSLKLNDVECTQLKPQSRKLPIRRITGAGRPDKNKGVNDASIKRDYITFDVPIGALQDGNNRLQVKAIGSSKKPMLIRADIFVAYGTEKQHGSF